MYPYERDMLERLWFPVAREADVNDGPVPAQLLGHQIVVYLYRELLDEFAADAPAALEQDQIGV